MNGDSRPPDRKVSIDRKVTERERELRIIRRRLVELQARLAVVREPTLALAEVETGRRLTPDEARQARELRWESEHLRHELLALREHFGHLTAAPVDG